MTRLYFRQQTHATQIIVGSSATEAGPSIIVPEDWSRGTTRTMSVPLGTETSPTAIQILVSGGSPTTERTRLGVWATPALAAQTLLDGMTASVAMPLRNLGVNTMLLAAYVFVYDPETDTIVKSLSSDLEVDDNAAASTLRWRKVTGTMSGDFTVTEGQIIVVDLWIQYERATSAESMLTTLFGNADTYDLIGESADIVLTVDSWLETSQALEFTEEAPGVNFGQMVTLVRNRVGDLSADQFTTTYIQSELNLAKDRAQDLIDQVDQWFFATTTSIAISAGTTSYAMPTDVRKVEYVERTDVNPPIPCEVIDYRQQELYREQGVSIQTSPVGFYAPVVYFKGSDPMTLGFPVAPAQSMTITVDYSQRLPDLTTDSDVWDGIPAYNGHEFIVTRAVNAIMASENNASPQWQGREQELAHAMLTTLDVRQRHGPRHVNVGRYDGW